MPPQLPVSSSYQDLLSAVKSALASGLLAAQRVLEHERLKTYWAIGGEIRARVAASNGELHFTGDLYHRISADLKAQAGLDLTADTIGRMVQFHRNYPRFPETTTLTFTHYIALQRLKDPKARQRLEQRAVRLAMTVPELKAAVAELNREEGSAAGARDVLPLARGEPYVYYVRPETGLDGQKRLYVDCGFRISVDLPDGNRYAPRQSRCVRSVKKDGAYSIRSYKKGGELIYTYAARVVRVVDGDTFDARVDVGFGIGLNERFRLKGIDTPEINTQAGLLARHFVEEEFSRCPLIVLRSSKAGVYGRWLADVFCLPGTDDPARIAAEGQYLNQTLLDRGLAKRY
jgi:endonuclease YncB( thermonuclease family)